MAAHKYVLFYDGVCGLCDRTVQFLIKRDPSGIFRFAPLQGPLAADVLPRHGKDPTDLDTVYLMVDDADGKGERVLSRSDAILYALKLLGGFWWLFALLSSIWPRPLRDLGYRLVAKTRYRLFGQYDACPLPTAETRARFLQ